MDFDVLRSVVPERQIRGHVTESAMQTRRDW